MWNLIKKIFHFITSVLMYSVFAILIIVFAAVILYFVDQKKAASSGVKRAPLFGTYVIISPSMVPNINVRDAVVTMRVESKNLKKGDVITFISTDPNHSGITITHRIVGIFETDNGGIAYRTKGDNNNTEDSTLVNYDNVLGKVMVRIPFVGYLQEILSTSYGWLLIIVLPAILIIGSDIIKLIKNLKDGDEKKEIKGSSTLEEKAEDIEEVIEQVDNKENFEKEEKDKNGYY